MQGKTKFRILVTLGIRLIQNFERKIENIYIFGSHFKVCPKTISNEQEIVRGSITPNTKPNHATTRKKMNPQETKLFYELITSRI
jgi:hypothetical protein